jgi:hypothetical protein
MPLIKQNITTKFSKRILCARERIVTLFRRGLHMGASVANLFGLFVAIFFGLFVAIFLLFLPLIMGKQWRAAQDRASARRMAEHRMNARLLRLNI